MMRTLVVVLCLLLLVSLAVLAQEEEKTCELGVDGTCIGDGEEGGVKNANPGGNDCANKHDSCEFWASAGECEENPRYMLQNCPLSCKICDKLEKVDMLIRERIDEKEERLQNSMDLSETPWGVEQTANDAATSARIAATKKYMTEKVLVDPEFDKVRKDCKNRHKDCAFWATSGECEANPKYMTLHCAPTCETCHLIDFDTRCPYDESVPTIWEAGDLDKMFDRITQDEYYEKYEPTILSMPSPPADSTISSGPWVVTLENLLTPEECDRLIELGAVEGYKISQDVGERKFDGSYDGFVNDRRTSTNAWCQDDCFKDPVTKQVLSKIENVTGIPDDNSEYLQLLRYEETQFYATHHDYIPHHVKRQEGVRLITVFLYLNDVEAGGGTDFPTLGITVMPKKGRALIWPSVQNSNPNAKDGRTTHQALPVEKGIKYGANAWVHQRNFKDVYHRGCH